MSNIENLNISIDGSSIGASLDKLSQNSNNELEQIEANLQLAYTFGNINNIEEGICINILDKYLA